MKRKEFRHAHHELFTQAPIVSTVQHASLKTDDPDVLVITVSLGTKLYQPEGAPFPSHLPIDDMIYLPRFVADKNFPGLFDRPLSIVGKKLHYRYKVPGVDVLYDGLDESGKKQYKDVTEYLVITDDWNIVIPEYAPAVNETVSAAAAAAAKANAEEESDYAG